MACNYWVSNSFTSFNDNRLPAETTQQAIAELGSDATLVKEEDLLKIIEYNILSLPALVIDGKVVSAGKRLSLKEVKELLTQ